MSEQTQQPSTYDVVLLVERELTEHDAAGVHELHEEIEDPVVYHVLIPLADAAARVEQSLGLLATGEMIAPPAMGMGEVDLEAVRRECEERSEAERDGCVDRLVASGANAHGDVVSGDPVDALAEKVAQVEAAEVIIITRPHLVAEFFHVDWTSKARRRLGVPVLHLLENEIPEDDPGEEQAD